MALSPEEIQWQLAHVNEDRAGDVIVSHVVLISLAVVAVVLRFISRRIKVGLHEDDWMILFALVSKNSSLLINNLVLMDTFHRSWPLGSVPEFWPVP